MNDDSLRNIEKGVVSYLADLDTITQEIIRTTITQYRCIPLYDSVTDEQAEHLARSLETRFNITMTIGGVLKGKGHEPWLDAVKAGIKPYYWERYQTLLVQGNGFSPKVVNRLGEVTDRILGLLRDPKMDGPWDRRGMVIGHVQSGKTANYIGLTCKAADAGYRLIVIIAGIHNNLRNQTQERVDEGFVGRDSAALLSRRGDQLVGVGRIDGSKKPATFTNSNSDFNKNTANAVGVSLDNLLEPAVLVIKKNTTTLRNLIDWLAMHNMARNGRSVDIPMLLIDDEADNASINVKYGKGEVSPTNALIRELLNLFDRSCYVGYTATPFANIFVEPDTGNEMLGEDLFPRDFIVSLDPPTNYFGSDSVFTNGDDGPVRYIEDHELVLPLKHKIDIQIDELPQSLKTAIQMFVVARAIRILRGQGKKHSSMLVNASRFTRVQGQLRNEIGIYLDEIQTALRVHGSLDAQKALGNSVISGLRNTWQEEYTDAEPDWAAVFGVLHEAAAPVKTVEVNINSSGALNYKDYKKSGLNVIAVGGFSLSRGLTLEGLIVSYFLRNSMMYDTLMQMARWFGYRPDYDDLCRVWMPEEAESWYAHISESIEMLRSDLKAMEAAGATPMEFGLKVRSHPDSLMVTARNKMGSARKVAVRIGLANSFVETSILKPEAQARDANLRSAERFAARLDGLGLGPSSAQHKGFGRLVSNVPVDPIVEFLRSFLNHQGSLLTDPDPVCRYIADREEDELAKWDVLFAGTADTLPTRMTHCLAGAKIYCQERTVGSRSNGSMITVTNKNRVSSRGIEKSGLSDDDIRDANTTYLIERKRKERSGTKVNVPDRVYRTYRTRPLLIIHLLDLKSKDKSGDSLFTEPTVAWSLSLPSTKKPNDRVEYVVGTVWLRENFGDESEDEDEVYND